MTAERFRPDPFGEPGGRIYGTGDLVRWRADGELDFLGRLDQQVKVRGSRIELGEIEAALRAHLEVREAAVVARVSAGQETQLAAYVTLACDDAVTAAELREGLRRSLPGYMVPATVTRLAALPLTAGGKVDRAALPAPEVGSDRFVAPRNEIEEELAVIWSEILGRERVSVEEDFFQLGGHSLQVVQIASRVRRAFEIELPVRAVFETPTLAGLAVRVVEEMAAQAGDEALAALLDEMESSGIALPEGAHEAQ